jgi:hypothetical protein
MLRATLFVLATLSLLSCNNDENTFLISDEHAVVLQKFQQMGEETEKVWPGYNYYRTKPLYIILPNADETGWEGYLVNPPGELSDGAQKVNDAQSGGLNVYLDNSHLAAAEALLGNVLFFNLGTLKINGESTFLIKDTNAGHSPLLTFYDNYKNVDNSLIHLFTYHEWFHVWQLSTWTFSSPGTNPGVYPVNREIATLELALFDLMKTLPDPSNANARKTHLSKFVALLDELFKVDPSPTKALGYYIPNEFFLEGTARYTEHYSALNSIYPTIDTDPTHGWSSVLPDVPAALINNFLTKRIWYHIGSGALFLLKADGVDIIAKTQSGENAYSMVKQHIVLTDQQQATIMADMKAAVAWSGYETMAAQLVP